MKTIKEILTESNGVLKLAVHNGVFHADDVLCVAMIKNKLKELGFSREVEIIRSRNSYRKWKYNHPFSRRMEVG